MYDDTAFGGNGDRQITDEDPVWNRLRLWVDRNHNGICDASEFGPIHQYHVAAIRLGYVNTGAPDPSANVHRLHGTYLRKVVGAGAAHMENAAADSLSFRYISP